LHGGALALPGHDALAIEGLFPGASAGSAADFSAFYGNAAGLGAQGQAVQADLLQTDSAHGSAFDSLHGSFGVSDIDLTSGCTLVAKRHIALRHGRHDRDLHRLRR
ncbi:hypothetical protein, partial [Thiorhodovibrio frisius]